MIPVGRLPLPRRNTFDPRQIVTDTFDGILLVVLWPLVHGYKALTNHPSIRYDRVNIFVLSFLGLGVVLITLVLANLWHTGTRSGWWVVAFLGIYALICILRTLLHIFGYEGDDWSE